MIGPMESAPHQAKWTQSLSLALLGVLPFLISLGGGFIYDDQNFLSEPRIIHSASPFSAAIWAGNFSDLEEASGVLSVPYYRPVTLLTYWLDHALWGSNPLGFHISNTLFFLLILFLIHRLLLKMLPAKTAGILLLLFSLHPAHCESVSWISGRTDLLSTLFFLGALWLLSPSAGTTRPSTPHLLSGLALLLLSLLSKESHLFLILPLPLLLGLWYHHTNRVSPPRRLGILWLAPILWFLLRLNYLPQSTPLDFTQLNLLRMLQALGYYTQKVLFPFPLSFTMDPGTLRPWHALVAILVLLLVVTELLRLPGALRSNPPAVPWVTLYVLALGPALLLQLSPEVYFTLAWRFLFLPVILPWGIVAHHIGRLQPRLGQLLTLLLLALFAAQALPMVWRLGRNEATFWSSLDPSLEHPMARIRAVMVGFPNDRERAEAVLDGIARQSNHPQYPRIMQETQIARATLLSQWGRCSEAERLWHMLTSPPHTPERVWMQFLNHCSICRNLEEGERILDRLLPRGRLSLGFLDEAVLFTFSSGHPERARALLNRMERENGRNGKERAQSWRTRHPVLAAPGKPETAPRP